jgi:hypothetical protein
MGNGVGEVAMGHPHRYSGLWVVGSGVFRRSGLDAGEGSDFLTHLENEQTCSCSL